jgi:hypothetical protein
VYQSIFIKLTFLIAVAIMLFGCHKPTTDSNPSVPVPGTSTTNVNVCSNKLPYLWNGHSYSTAGSYSVTLHNSNGTDSTANLVLTLSPNPTSSTSASVLTSELPYLWNGTQYSYTGTYRDTISRSGGCDSIATLLLNYSSVSNSDFPNTINSYWKYTLYDSGTSTLDTVIVTVSHVGYLDDFTPATAWAFVSYSRGPDTDYVTTNGDVKIHRYNSYNTIKKRYVFPLAVGNKWITQNQLDTNYVTEQNSITVIAGTFSGAYRIQRNTNIPYGLNRIIEDEWFVPGVGMVKRMYKEMGQGAYFNQLWELVSYEIH